MCERRWFAKMKKRANGRFTGAVAGQAHSPAAMLVPKK
jgi:hypothetical protein